MSDTRRIDPEWAEETKRDRAVRLRKQRRAARRHKASQRTMGFVQEFRDERRQRRAGVED